MSADALRITMLTQPDCAFCEHAEQVLVRVGHDYPLVIRRIALESEEGREMAVRHGVLFAPGVLLDGELVGYGRLSERRLRRQLSRRDQLSAPGDLHGAET
ncbi:MAG: glutaredoxin family protein [Pseudonocardia sp.]